MPVIYLYLPTHYMLTFRTSFTQKMVTTSFTRKLDTF